MPNDPETTILFLAANPLDMDQAQLGVEVRSIKVALRQATNGSRFRVEDEWAVRSDDLRRALLRYRERPVILHFAGHGNGDSIYLEDDSRLAKAVDADAFASLLALFPNIRCVVLNACYSEAMGDALVEGVPCVIGMATNATDEGAIKFAEAFYDAVGSGLPYAQAFRVAKESLPVEKVMDHLQPVFRAGARFQSETEDDETPEDQGQGTRDRIEIGHINSMTGSVIGGGKVKANIISGSNQIARPFQGTYERIQQRQPDPSVDNSEVLEMVQRIEEELSKEEAANPDKIARWLRNLNEVAPDIFNEIIFVFTNFDFGISSAFRKTVLDALSKPF